MLTQLLNSLHFWETNELCAEFVCRYGYKKLAARVGEMGYYMRFLFADGAPPSLDEIEAAMKAVDPDISIERDLADADGGELYHNEELLGVIEVNSRGDPLCDEDIEEFIEELGKHDDPNRMVVLDVLERATGMVVVQVLFGGHENPQYLDMLWDWLFNTRVGLLQVDEEGFFDGDERVISLL
jgi:hypothetical protein